MATAHLSSFLRRLTRGMAAETLADQSDQQLVEKALAGRDDAIFQAIVQRHGAMVYRVCWRVLQHDQEAEDAFQATFLILARKLGSVRKSASLASWLHGVAYRVALKTRAQISTRRRHEQQARCRQAVLPDDVTWKEFRAVLDAELGQLPEKWRLPLILCYLEGRTQDEAAKQLGWSKTTLRNRLREARDALGCRLKGRGIAWSAALSAVLLSDCIAPASPASGLVASTIEAASLVAAGQAATTIVSVKVAALTEGVLKAMFLTKLKGVTTILLLLSLPLFGIGLWTTHLAVGQQATPPLQANANPVKPKADTERLQGTWEVIETRSDGETRPVPESLDGRLVIEGDEFRLMFWSKPTKLEGNTRSGNVLLATYKLNTTKSPRNIDLITSKDPAAHKLCLGIYKLDGDDLMICLPREKPERRPAEFTADKGSGQQLYKLKRAKAETGAPKKDTPKGETAKEAEQQKVKETTAKLEEAEQQKEKEAAKLKGTWKTVAVEIAGQALPEDTAKANVWEIAVYGKLKTKLPNNKEGTELEVRPFTIDPTKKPAHIDIEGEVGGNKTVTEGIYKLDGDELAVCLIGVKGGRPSEFFSCQFDKGDEKGGNILMKFKRVQEDKAKEDKEKDDKRVQENKVKEDKEKTDKRVQENKVKEDKEKEDKELAPQKDEPKKGDKQRASIAPVKSPGSSLATTIKIGDISYTLPFAFPSGEEILRALPAKVRPKNGRIEGELLEYRLDAPKDYPLVGRGRLAQARFKCTVFTDSGNEIVYIDRDHLVVEK